MHRYSVLTMGNGASVSTTFYATCPQKAADLGRQRFAEVWSAAPTFTQVEDMGECQPQTHPFQAFATLNPR